MKNDLLNNELSSELLEELEKVIALINKALGRKPSTNSFDDLSDETLALIHIAKGFSMKKWGNLRQNNLLNNWLAIPIQKNTATAIQEILTFQSKLAHQRDHDPLTGLGNRRLFLRQLNAEFERARRSNTDASIILLDIDDFKRINDDYGHVYGDIVLQTLAELLASSVRSYDTVVRYGGEEFIIILPATTAGGAANLANKLRISFNEKIFMCNDKLFSITFSAGISSIKQFSAFPTADELLEAADKALYKAKETGKNCACISESILLQKGRSLVQPHEKQFLFFGKSSGNLP